MKISYSSSRRTLLLVLVIAWLFPINTARGAAPPSTLTAGFVGVGADVVSQVTLSKDGQPDFQIRLGGLRATPTQITVTSDTGGIWANPFNGVNWVVGLVNATATTGDIYFAQFTSNRFHVQVKYSDGTVDDADASNAGLSASFVGVGGDVVGQTALAPDGQPDFHITLGGLRASPTQVKVTSDTGGIWNMPFNGVNWVVGLTNVSGANGDLYFAQFTSNKFHVQVFYADGTSDQVDATNQPSALTASYLGLGSDVVGRTTLSPDGQPDFHIALSGLRSPPTQIKVTSDTGGIWNMPFNGVNWVVGLTNTSGANGDIYFAQFTSNKFRS